MTLKNAQKKQAKAKELCQGIWKDTTAVSVCATVAGEYEMTIVMFAFSGYEIKALTKLAGKDNCLFSESRGKVEFCIF